MDFFSKWDQIRSFQQIWSRLLKKILMRNFIFFYAVCNAGMKTTKVPYPFDTSFWNLVFLFVLYDFDQRDDLISENIHTKNILRTCSFNYIYLKRRKCRAKKMSESCAKFCVIYTTFSWHEFLFFIFERLLMCVIKSRIFFCVTFFGLRHLKFRNF